MIWWIKYERPRVLNSLQFAVQMNSPFLNALRSELKTFVITYITAKETVQIEFDQEISMV